MEYYKRTNFLNYYTKTNESNSFCSVVRNQRLLWNHLPSFDVSAMHVNLFKTHMEQSEWGKYSLFEKSWHDVGVKGRFWWQIHMMFFNLRFKSRCLKTEALLTVEKFTRLPMCSRKKYLHWFCNCALDYMASTKYGLQPKPERTV